MRNSGNYFRWPARPFATAVAGARGKRRLVRFGVHAIRMLAALCVFLAISMSPARNALAEDVKESLAPKIVQEMQCGSHRVVITCGRARPGERPAVPDDSRVCVHNTLKFIDARGKTHISKFSPQPAIDGFGWTPDSMGCGKGKGGEYYVEVRYAYCDGGSCETMELFTESGVPLVNMQDEYRRYLKLKREKKFRILYQ